MRVKILQFYLGIRHLCACVLHLGLPNGESKIKISFGTKLFLSSILMFLFSLNAFSQNHTISGKITDIKGEELIGVSIQLKNTTTGTTTNMNGEYSLNVPSSGGVLVFTYIGFHTQENSFTASTTTMNVQLVEDQQALDEVVVTGYATEAKKDIVGSVAVVKMSELLATPSANVSQQLQGRSAGVTVQTDGTPGGAAKVRIRGFGSFGGSDPLYIIDGVPATGGGGTSSPIDNLNPNDIESLQVLKDAAAASVYGARAANGVVIITTKSGKAGAPKFTYDSYYGSNYVSKSDFPALLNAQEWGEYYWKAMAGAGYEQGGPGWFHPQYGSGATPIIPEYILVTGTGANKSTALGGAALEILKTTDPVAFADAVNPDNYDFASHQIVKSGDTDWFREVYKPAMQLSQQLGVSGGSDKGVYAMSLNYFNQDNTYSRDHFFKRYTFRANSSFKVRNNIHIGENVQISYTTKNLNNESASTLWAMHPLIPVYDIMGNPASSQAQALSGANAQSRNPVTEPWRNRFDRQNDFGVFGNVYGEINIIEGLSARTSFGIDNAYRDVKDFTPRTFEHAENTVLNSLLQRSNSAITWTWTNTAAYNHTFAEKHNFKILIGTEAIKSYSETLSGTNTNYDLNMVDDPNFLVINAGQGTQSTTGDFERQSLYSLFSRIDYSFDDKYLLNATLRQDQSSKFAASTRKGYFPSVAVGWRLSSEAFLQNVDWISDLKLRASWGKIGNQNGLDFLNQYSIYSANLAQSYSTSGSNTIASPLAQSRYGNPTARWEENVTTNIGIDATIFNSWNLTADWYIKQTNGLLVTNQPAFTGATGAQSPSQPAINAGDMKNTGIDIGVSKRGQILDGFQYDVSVSFSKYKNEVTKILDNPLSTLVGGSTRQGNVTLTSVGNPVSMFYGYKVDGFFNTQEEVDEYIAAGYNSYIPPQVGRWRIKDVNNDGAINALDRTFIGSPHPDFQMGLNLALRYKNLDFAGFLFWNQGNEVFNQSRYWVDFNTYSINRSEKMLYESWTPELGNNAKLPVLDLGDTYSNLNVTDYYVQDASYLRLKTLQLGYTLPAGLLSKLKIDAVRIYAQGQNLFTIHKKEFDGLDPDSGLSGADLSMGVVDNLSPTPKQILFGLSFGF